VNTTRTGTRACKRATASSALGFENSKATLAQIVSGHHADEYVILDNKNCIAVLLGSHPGQRTNLLNVPGLRVAQPTFKTGRSSKFNACPGNKRKRRVFSFEKREFEA
jgi:hypothetical protein